jgi:hypothetical protein
VTARPQDVELLPLSPTLTIVGDGQDGISPQDRGYWVRLDEAKSYARANLSAALASAQAREEALRAEIRKLTVKCRILQRAVDRYMPCPDCRDKIEPGCCERCRRQVAEARSERLEEALRDMLDEYGQLHAKFDLGECQATMNARAALTTNAAQPGETM